MPHPQPSPGDPSRSIPPAIAERFGLDATRIQEALRVQAEGAGSANRTLTEADAEKLDGLRGWPVSEILVVLGYLPAGRLPELQSALAETRRDQPVTGKWPGAEEAQPKPKPAAPKTLGRYELRQELGRGGMGVVYLAYDTELKREVALKLLLAGDAASEDQLARFQREARAAAQLQHPHTAATFDVGVVDGKHYITIELLRGGSLAEMLKTKRRLAARPALQIMQQVSDAVAHAHAHGIVHRDLKPENILFDDQGRPKVTDFGLARIATEEGSRRTASGSVLGTPHYMSPEQAAGETADLRSDVYSLGAILYELVTGRTPYPNGAPMEVILAKLKNDPPPPSSLLRSLPSEVETIIRKAMERDLDRRYPSALTFAEDLRRFLAGEPILARPDELAYRARKWIRRRWVGAAVAVCGGLALAVTVWTARQGSSFRDQTRHAQSVVVDQVGRLEAVAIEATRQESALGAADKVRQEFEHAFAAARSESPDAPEIYCAMARLRRIQGRYDDAAKLVAEALARDPQDPIARYEGAATLSMRLESRYREFLRPLLLREALRRCDLALLAGAGCALRRPWKAPSFAEWLAQDAAARAQCDELVALLGSLQAEWHPARRPYRPTRPDNAPPSKEQRARVDVVQGMLAVYQAGATATRESDLAGALTLDPALEEAFLPYLRIREERRAFSDVAVALAEALKAAPGWLSLRIASAQVAWRIALASDPETADWEPPWKSAAESYDRVCAWDPSRRDLTLERSMQAVGYGAELQRRKQDGKVPLQKAGIALGGMAKGTDSPDSEEEMLLGSLCVQAVRMRPALGRSGVNDSMFSATESAAQRVLDRRPDAAEVALWTGHFLWSRGSRSVNDRASAERLAYLRRAVDLFTRVAASDPAAPEGWVRCGLCGWEAALDAHALRQPADELFGKALENLERAEQSAPPPAGVESLRGNLLSDWSRVRSERGEDVTEPARRAMEIFARAQPGEPGSAASALSAATVAMLLAQSKQAQGGEATDLFRDALSWATKATDVDAQSAAAWMLRGRIGTRLGAIGQAQGIDADADLASAETAFAEAAKCGAPEAELHLARGRLYRMMGDGLLDRGLPAEARYQQAQGDLDAAGNGIEARMERGLLGARWIRVPGSDSQLQQGHFVDATNEFAAVVKEDGSRLDAQEESAECELNYVEMPCGLLMEAPMRLKFEMKILDQSIQKFDLVLRQQPERVRALLGRARARWVEAGDQLRAKGKVGDRLERALADVDAAAHLVPDASSPRWLRAEILVTAERWEEAAREFDAAVKADPEAEPRYRAERAFAAWQAAGAPAGTGPIDPSTRQPWLGPCIPAGKSVTWRVPPSEYTGSFEVLTGEAVKVRPDGTLSWTPVKEEGGRHSMLFRAGIRGRVWTIPMVVEVVLDSADKPPVRVADPGAAPKEGAATDSTSPGPGDSLDGGGWLPLESDRAKLVPSAAPEALAVLDGKSLHFISRDGLHVIRTVKFEKEYGAVQVREGSLVALERAALDILEPQTGKIVRSISLPTQRATDLAIDPTSPVSWVTLVDPEAVDAKAFLYCIVVRVDEKTGEVVRYPDAFGVRIAVHPSGRRVLAMYHDYCREAVNVVTPLGRLVCAADSDLDLLFEYAVEKGDLVRIGLNEHAGWNGSGLRLSGDGKYVSYIAGGGYRSGPKELQGYTIPAFPVGDVSAAATAYRTDAYPIDVAYHPRLPWTAACNEKAVLLFDRDSGKALPPDKLEALGEHEAGRIRELAFAPDGRRVLVLLTRGDRKTVLRSLAVRWTPEEEAAAAKPMAPAPLRERAGAPEPAKISADAFEAMRAPAGGARVEPRDIAKEALPAVVIVEAPESSATGFFVGSGGYVLTCAHAVPMSGGIVVRYRSGADAAKGIEAKAAILRLDSALDLALLQIAVPAPVKTLRLAKALPEMGERLVILGNPGTQRQVLEHTLTLGVVSSPNRVLGKQTYIQTDASVNPGTSGSPIFDEQGNVTGMVVLKADLEGVGFGVPAERLRAFLAGMCKVAGGK